MKDTKVEGLFNLPLWLKKATETRGVTWESRHEGLEGSWHEFVKVNPGFCWRPQDVGDSKAMGCLLRRTAKRQRN